MLIECFLCFLVSCKAADIEDSVNKLNQKMHEMESSVIEEGAKEEKISQACCKHIKIDRLI